MIAYYRCVVFLVFFVKYFATADEVNGICDVTPMITKTRYTLDGKRKQWILQNYNVPDGPAKYGCCEGYRNATSGSGKLQCEPVCEPACVRAICDAPGTCVCLVGHIVSNGSNNTCIDVCDACVNSRCLSGFTDCICDPGYEKVASHPHVCQPACEPACVNATCVRPGRCDCLPGYRKRAPRAGVVTESVCEPQCGDGCLHGACVAPDQCACRPGYTLDEGTPYACKPVCERNCTNGFCASPGVCGCDEGMEIHRSDPFLCVPISSENARGSCEVNASRAIEYDPNTKCFKLTRYLETWLNESYCAPVEGVLKDCSIYANNTNITTVNNCTLNFRCQASEQLDSRFKIDCSYESGDLIFTFVNDKFNYTQRKDVTINLKAFTRQNLPNAYNGEAIQVWDLRPFYDGPLCGQKHFGVKLSSKMVELKHQTPTNNTESVTARNHSNHIKDRPHRIWLPVLFVVAVVVCGALWLRKRIFGVKPPIENSNSFDNPMYVSRGSLLESSAG